MKSKEDILKLYEEYNRLHAISTEKLEAFRKANESPKNPAFEQARKKLTDAITAENELVERILRCSDEL
jgi:hypothetical protein